MITLGEPTADPQQRAMALHGQGRLSEAREAYLRILEQSPRNVAVMSLLGAVSMQSNDSRGALDWLGKAIALDPDNVVLLTNLAAAHSQLNQHEGALNCYDRAIALQPGLAALHYNRAVALFFLKRHDAALAGYDRVLAMKSQLDAQACYDRGTVLLKLGRAAEAVESFERALARGTNLSPGSKLNCGFALIALGRHEPALASFEDVLALEPLNARAHKGRGWILYELGRYDAAQLNLERAIALDPADAESRNLLGLACSSAGRPEQALASFDAAIALDAGLVAAHNNRSKVLAEMGQLDAAIASLDRALELTADPRAAGADSDRRRERVNRLLVRANLLLHAGDRRAALAGFEEVLKLDPGLDIPRLARAFAQIPAVASTASEAAESGARFEAALVEFDHWLGTHGWNDPVTCIGSMLPFYLAYHGQDVRDPLVHHGGMCATALQEWQRSSGLVAAREPPSTKLRVGKLRVGIVSAQICDHSVYMAIVRGLLQGLDHDRLSIDVFHLGSKVDAETHRARALAEHFVQGSFSLDEWVRVILERRPQILLYPEIGMDQRTFQLACLRLADVQMASWGHPVTTGLPSIDFFLSAEAFEPPEADRHYSEKLVRLPRLGVYYEPQEALAAPTLQNAQPRERGPLLVCAGTPYKYAPQHDVVFVEIARRLGRCEFVLFDFNSSLTRCLLGRLREAFAAAGMRADEYVSVQPRMLPDEFHVFMGSADVYLDTLGFSGFNTVMKALASGLPVVTHRGPYLRGRLGSGILELLSAPELVADSPSAYVDRVVALASDPAARAHWRAHLARELPRAYRERTVIDALQSFLLNVG